MTAVNGRKLFRKIRFIIITRRWGICIFRWKREIKRFNRLLYYAVAVFCAQSLTITARSNTRII